MQVRRLFWFSCRREEWCTLMDKSFAGRSLLYSTWLIEILCCFIDQTTWCSGPMQAGCVAGPSSGAFGRRIDSVERCWFYSTAFWYLALRRADRFPFNGSYLSRDLESHLLLSWMLKSHFRLQFRCCGPGGPAPLLASKVNIWTC